MVFKQISDFIFSLLYRSTVNFNFLYPSLNIAIDKNYNEVELSDANRRLAEKLFLQHYNFMQCLMNYNQFSCQFEIDNESSVIAFWSLADTILGDQNLSNFERSKIICATIARAEIFCTYHANILFEDKTNESIMQLHHELTQMLGVYDSLKMNHPICNQSPLTSELEKQLDYSGEYADISDASGNLYCIE